MSRFHLAVHNPELLLGEFVKESNRIEGIHRHTGHEVDATRRFLAKAEIEVADLAALVSVYAPGHVLRNLFGLNVRVGSHIAPQGGPDIPNRLQEILRIRDPYDQHIAYETLHPFTDGNGRSGRALWLWSMGGIENTPLGFLHHFYYQTLDHSDDRKPKRALPTDAGTDGERR